MKDVIHPGKLIEGNAEIHTYKSRCSSIHVSRRDCPQNLILHQGFVYFSRENATLTERFSNVSSTAVLGTKLFFFQ